MPSHIERNKFCALTDLSNEASVEQFFVNRLLSDLGYCDADIVPKASLSAHTVSLGRRRVHFRPDYALKVDRRVRWICEAKAPAERLDRWAGQCASYCLELNRAEADNPVRYYMLTNGARTNVHPWDSDRPILSLGFADFVDGSPGYEQLLGLLSPGALRATVAPAVPDESLFRLQRRSVSELNNDFAWAHRQIHRRENLSYGAAFMEFVKIIFLKLLSDQRARGSANQVEDADGDILVPRREVRFSKEWIEAREQDSPNPLDTLQFRELLQGLETDIQAGTKKRIFKTDERLNLSNETIKALAERLQSTDLFAIDADLNGRLFETFLNATLRGKDLGQYFTPRSVVKLASRLANLQATPGHIDTVLDACCGTGGFLIDALAEMWSALDANASLTDVQRSELKKELATQRLFGVDIARDPALARIARINMYLHGDGGSRIYQLDALDKRAKEQSTDTVELKGEKSEFRKLLQAHPDGFADVVLTNPPFAKEYSRDQSPDAQLLDDYDLAFATVGGARRPLPSLRSSVMFLERYFDLLKPGGRMVTVVDDGILGGDSYAGVRQWIKSRFVVRAVVSLPGDAFQRSQARVKTSLLVLEKRSEGDDSQPAVFMYYCTAVGVDDAARQRTLPIDLENRRRANEEIDQLDALYDAFLGGQPEAAEWTVPADAIAERLDVKACLAKAGTRTGEWANAGLDVRSLGDLLEPVYSRGTSSIRPDGVLVTSEAENQVTLLRVRYDGFAESGDVIEPGATQYRHLFQVRSRDVVFSHINAIHGAVAVVPPELDGHYVTNEYTVCRSIGGMDPRLVWALVRSPEARADLVLLSTGIGRTRIDWERASMLQVPVPTQDLARRILDEISAAEDAERQAQSLREAAQQRVYNELLMDSSRARSIISAFKPPR